MGVGGKEDGGREDARLLRAPTVDLWTLILAAFPPTGDLFRPALPLFLLFPVTYLAPLSAYA